MRKLLISFAVVLAAMFTFQSCSESTPKVELSAEMKGFVDLIKGTSDDVVNALETYAATDELKDHDMGMYDLKDAKVTKKEGDCYSVIFKSGMIEINAVFCWEDGKIVSITEKQ